MTMDPTVFRQNVFRPNDAEPRLCSFNPFEASRGFNRSFTRSHRNIKIDFEAGFARIRNFGLRAGKKFKLNSGIGR